MFLFRFLLLLFLPAGRLTFEFRLTASECRWQPIVSGYTFTLFYSANCNVYIMKFEIEYMIGKTAENILRSVATTRVYIYCQDHIDEMG